MTGSASSHWRGLYLLAAAPSTIWLADDPDDVAALAAADQSLAAANEFLAAATATVEQFSDRDAYTDGLVERAAAATTAAAEAAAASEEADAAAADAP